jgi:hypothetical protein
VPAPNTVAKMSGGALQVVVSETYRPARPAVEHFPDAPVLDALVQTIPFPDPSSPAAPVEITDRATIARISRSD